MKKTITYLFFVILCYNTTLGQKKTRQQKITEARVRFIIEELHLTTYQAKQFTEIHQNFRTEMFRIARERNQIQKRISKETFSESQAKKLIIDLEEKEQLLFKNKMRFYKNLKPVLSYQQTLKLRLAEIKFKKRLLEKIKR